MWLYFKIVILIYVILVCDWCKYWFDLLFKLILNSSMDFDKIVSFK